MVLVAGMAVSARALDLTQAVVVASGMRGPSQKAVSMLIEEAGKRTGVYWKQVSARPAGSVPAIVVTNAAAGPAEGYRIAVRGKTVRVAGNDARGVLFGVGRLLRELRMARGKVTVPDGFSLRTAPRYRLRGHQLGYRPKSNTYDGWTRSMFEQYIRDLAVFGTNAIELIPPRSDDARWSPLFPEPQLKMMAEISRICADYGLAVWIWYPALDKDYSNPATVEKAVQEWAVVFRRLPRIDAVFVPGGDPGHTPPRYLLPLLEKQAASLRRYHPKAQMWLSPQGFSQPWMDDLFAALRREPAWLSGIVYGPGNRIGLPELRKLIPARCPIRHYPDITHTAHNQYSVPRWDLAFALTEGREPIDPRPVDEAIIFRRLQPYTIGFITYSEGCNDDVNKMLWSALGWNPKAHVIDILRQYSRYFLGPRYADTYAQALLALERNWRGPLLTNGRVPVTLEQFQAMEGAAAPRDLLNWRFQQGLYRAYYDAYIQQRLRYETSLETQAMSRLRQAGRLGTREAMREAEAILDRAVSAPVAQDLRTRVFSLAEALFESIRMQLSVRRYRAIGVSRGANLDAIDTPLNDAPWLKVQFARIRRLKTEAERRRALDRIVNWTNPGPGGFYDDLGNPVAEPHLVRGPGYPTDPEFLHSELDSFVSVAGQPSPPLRISWLRYALSASDAPLRMRYTGLDPHARYRVRVTYSGRPSKEKIVLTADGKWRVHPPLLKPFPIHPLEFAIPRAATADGTLTLTWKRAVPGGPAGRGVEIAEVWLIREPEK